MDWQIAIDVAVTIAIIAVFAFAYVTRSPKVSTKIVTNNPAVVTEIYKAPHVHGPLKLRSQHEEAGKIVLVKECVSCGDLIRDKQE